jgi:tRNA(Ile)-lysidine synthetase-like protein
MQMPQQRHQRTGARWIYPSRGKTWAICGMLNSLVDGLLTLCMKCPDCRCKYSISSRQILGKLTICKYSRSSQVFSEKSKDVEFLDGIVESQKENLSEKSFAGYGLNDVIAEHSRATLLDDIIPSVAEEIVLERESKNLYHNDLSLTLVVGVSGGCDSIALIRVLNDILNVSTEYRRKKGETQFTFKFKGIHAVHFDHQQRGIASDGDREFVQMICEQELKIPFHCYRYHDDFHEKSETTTKFTQEIGRNWRRNKMRQLLKQIMSTQQSPSLSAAEEIGLLVTAHHQNDSDETFLMKFIRGVHLSNLQGLPAYVRDEDCDDDQKGLNSGSTEHLDNKDHIAGSSKVYPFYWIRPFINIQKVEIQQFLRHNRFSWREDASNQSDKYLRNRIRNELVPLLEELMYKSSTKESDETDATIPYNKCIGGVVHRRLEMMQQQSVEIRNDLDKRADEYLEISGSIGDAFFLHMFIKSLDDNHIIDGSPHSFMSLSSTWSPLVFKHALYKWIKIGHPNVWISYERISFVVSQVMKYPKRVEWRINLGKGYDIQRIGDTLLVRRDEEANTVDHGTHSNNFFPWRRLNWSKNSTEVDNERPDDSILELPVWVQESDVQFHLTLLSAQSTMGFEHVSLNKLHFLPPWRRGRTPIEIGDFLRGQKVPLYERKHAPIIVMSSDTEHSNSNSAVNHPSDLPYVKIVAVYVQTKSKWLIDSDFSLPSDSDEIGIEMSQVRTSGKKRILLHVPERM